MHSLYQSSHPQVMGILNVTPDSFSDGGEYIRPELAIERAQKMIDEGADIIDVGGESTRPGAAAVELQQELDRVIPVIEAISVLGTPVSIDTSKAEVMMEAVRAGASMINDVYALQNAGAVKAAAECKVPVCLMHMQGQPRTMQANPKYRSVVEDVLAFLQQRVETCTAAGIDRSLISIDPGFGFGKTLQHNLEMLRRLDEFQSLSLPVLVGLSRKSMLGDITGKSVEDRGAASISVAMIAAMKNANIIRVHDVAETKDAIRVYAALYKRES